MLRNVVADERGGGVGFAGRAGYANFSVSQRDFLAVDDHPQWKRAAEIAALDPARQARRLSAKTK